MLPMPTGGITPAVTGSFPNPSRSDLGTTGTAFACEALVAGVVGQYNYNFTAALYREITNNASSGVDGSFFNFSNFEKVKFGTCTMRMKRIDTGSSWGTLSDGGGAIYPTNFGVRETPVIIHYQYLPQTTVASADFSPASFSQDPRTKHRRLRCGRSLSFKFRLTEYTMAFESDLSRFYEGAGRQVHRRLQRPVGERAKGWFPVQLIDQSIVPTNAFQTAPGAPAFSGISPNLFQHYSNTLLVMVEIQFAGTFATPDGAVFTPFAVPLITRTETCRVSFKGLRPVPALGVSQCVSVAPFPTPAPGTAGYPNTGIPLTEKCALTALYIDTLPIPSNPTFAAVNASSPQVPYINTNPVYMSGGTYIPDEATS